MKREEVQSLILHEAIRIQKLVEEKKKIEEDLKKIEDEDASDFDKVEDESLSTNISLANKKSMPKRLGDPHKLEEEQLDEILHDSPSLGVGIKHSSGGHKNKMQESLSILRKIIKKQLYESYGINKLKEEIKTDLYIVKIKHDNGTTKIETSGTNKENAEEKVMKSEKCPKSAIMSTTKK